MALLSNVVSTSASVDERIAGYFDTHPPPPPQQQQQRHLSVDTRSPLHAQLTNIGTIFNSSLSMVAVISAHLLRTEHTTLGDRSFAVAGPRVWNSLPATIRQITSYGQFRQHRLKTHLFRTRKLQRIMILDYCALYK